MCVSKHLDVCLKTQLTITWRNDRELLQYDCLRIWYDSPNWCIHVIVDAQITSEYLPAYLCRNQNSNGSMGNVRDIIMAALYPAILYAMESGLLE